MREAALRVCQTATLLALTFLQAQASAPAAANERFVTVEGHVLASTGTVIPGAIVRMTPMAGADVDLVTDGEGAFRQEGLVSGLTYTFEIVAGAQGSGSTRVVATRPGEVLHLDLVSHGQLLTIPGPLIDSEEAAVRTEFDAGFIDGLPIIGHNYQDVLTLAPGVEDPDGDGNPNVHGSRDTGLSYRFDKGDTTDPATGTFGMNLNPVAIESVDVITAGAPAEYGRAVGGFATITTRTGGNALEGRLVLYWRGRFLDGDGAGNEDVFRFDGDEVNWHDFRTAAGVGGPIVKDHLWYFVAAESLNTEQPTGQFGDNSLITSHGFYGFAKLTWRVDEVHKLGLQIAADPRRFEGLGLYSFSSDDSGYTREQQALDVQLHWTASISPDLLLEAAVTSFESDVTEAPTSSRFRPMPIALSSSSGTLGDVAAAYPCTTFNCDGTADERSIFQSDFGTGRITGPYYRSSDEDRDRHALKADLSWGYEEFAGTHHLKAGMEFADETLRSDLIVNPILYDLTAPAGPPNHVTGIQILETVQQTARQRKADGFSTGLYIADSWKPLSNLVLTLGLRFDAEQIDAPGFTPINPVRERRQSIDLWQAYCQELVRQGLPILLSSNCHPLNTYDGQPPDNFGGFLSSFLDQNMDGVNDVPPEIAALDLNGDGFIATVGTEGQELFKHFTRLEERESVNFDIENTSWSPRVGLSWDPLNDGLTRLYASWGRYYDRIPLETGLADSAGASMTFGFTPDPVTHVIVPGALSTSSSRASITQLSHHLRPARTDELSLGFERLFGASWSMGGGYIRRKATDLPQDIEQNHYTCRQADDLLGIDPLAVCGFMGVLQTDQFGAVGGPFVIFQPNGIEDLYATSYFFNRVFLVENVDSADYQAYELRVSRNLDRNWQMHASYTWSQSRGSAERTFSVLGDDPSTPIDEDAYLDYDQRHRIKFQMVAHLPYGFILGHTIAWASGSPYTVAIASVSDLDSSGNSVQRYLLPTGERNDQRNESIWRLNGRLEKVFTLGKVRASGFLLAEDLLNTDDLTIYSIEPDGSGLVATRESGRRFEVGASLEF